MSSGNISGTCPAVPRGVGLPFCVMKGQVFLATDQRRETCTQPGSGTSAGRGGSSSGTDR
jgi:hypothetical protein